MNETNNVSTETENEEVVTTEEVVAEAPTEEVQPEEPAPQLDQDNPLTQVSEKQLGAMMKQMRDIAGMMEAQWNNTRQEFNLADAHMRALYNYNEEHRTPPPEGMTQEDQNDPTKYDRFNGLDKITPEEIVTIFGENHPIIGIAPDPNLSGHQITIDRVKSSINDFFAWMAAIKDYRQVHDAYMELIEFEEEKSIVALKMMAEKEEDPIKKAKMFESVELYENRKYLDFLSEPIDPTLIDRLVKAFSDQNKVAYWLERTKDRMNQLQISPKFILEISQLEKRFLPREYHHQSNIFLLYFMNMVVYHVDVHNKKDDNRSKVVCIVFAMDRFVRNVWPQEIRERILTNLIAFQEQFMGKLPRVETTSDVKDPVVVMPTLNTNETE